MYPNLKLFIEICNDVLLFNIHLLSYTDCTTHSFPYPNVTFLISNFCYLELEDVNVWWHIRFSGIFTYSDVPFLEVVLCIMHMSLSTFLNPVLYFVLLVDIPHLKVSNEWFKDGVFLKISSMCLSYLISNECLSLGCYNKNSIDLVAYKQQ